MLSFSNGIFITQAYLAPRGGKLAVFVKKVLSVVVRIVTGAYLTWMFLQFLPNGLQENALYFTGIAFTVLNQCGRWQKIGLGIVQNTKYVRIKMMAAQTWQKAYKSAAFLSIGLHIVAGFVVFVRGYGQKEQKPNPFMSITLCLCNWLLCSFIVWSFALMHAIFEICLSDFVQFPLQKASTTHFTLSDALVCTKIPLIQQLGALNFYKLGETYNKHRRVELFALSSVGGHPYTWKQVNEAANCVIQRFLADLNTIIDLKKPIPNPARNNYPLIFGISEQNRLEPLDATRKLNESLGIRHMLSSPPPPRKAEPVPEAGNKSFAFIVEIPVISRAIKAAKAWLAEDKELKVKHMLQRESQKISWITQGFAGIVDHSLAEDRFGVVQDHLGAIVNRIFELHQTLEKIHALGLVKVKTDRNYIALRATTKGSAFRISKVLRPYIAHISGLGPAADTIYDFYPACFAQ